tara:strand:- start:29963 stop:31132 length:1170 start_codon:yes stop_codon:yes gene_type:complete
MSQIKLNVEELGDFVKHMITNNQHIQKKGLTPVTINVSGDAGLGKTSSIIQLGKELGLQVEKLNLSQLEELGDLIGFPVKEFKVKNSEGKVLWVTEQEISLASEKGYKVVDKRMSHAKPAWIQGKKDGGILILDDFTRADHRFMQAVMEICDRQEYVSWKLPKNWHVILTTNPDNGDYNVTSLDVAQQTRFISVDLKFDEKVWAKWAESVGMDNRCINFLLMHPELVTQKVNPRSITTFFNAISSIEKFEEQLPMIQMVGEGSVGLDFSSMFTMFINNKLDRIISPEDIMTKDTKYVFSSLKSMIGEDDEFRADISSVVSTRVVNYLVNFAKTNPISAQTLKRVEELFIDCKSFTDDLKYFIVKEVVNANKQKFGKLMMNPKIANIIIK